MWRCGSITWTRAPLQTRQVPVQELGMVVPRPSCWSITMTCYGRICVAGFELDPTFIVVGEAGSVAAALELTTTPSRMSSPWTSVFRQ